MPTDGGCKTSRRGGGWLAVGYAALLAIVMASTQGCGSGSDDGGGDGGGGNPIRDFGGHFLKAIRCAVDGFKDFVDEIHSGKQVWEDAIKLQHSTTDLFPDVALTDEQGIIEICGNALGGTISYNGVSIPDLDKIDLYVPYTQDEHSFFKDYQLDLFARLADFEVRANKLENLNGANVHDKYHDVAVETNNLALDGGTATWTQGYNNWQSDGYAGQLVGHTLLASLLEPGNANEWILDLLETKSASEPVQVKKQQILAMWPDSLLKSRATFLDGASGPTLVKVEVQTSAKLEGSRSSGVQWEIIRDEALLEFTSSSGVKWDVAKKVFFSGAQYALECFHTAMHLFQGSVIAAIRNSVPAGSLIGETAKPQSQQVLLTLLEQVASLHANHGPDKDQTVFLGGVWPTRNHNLVWDNTRDIARYFADSSPPQLLGDPQLNKPDWWAGMSSSFIAPIAKFADAMATKVFEENQSQEFLTSLQAKLEESGLVVKPASPVDVSTAEGLGKFLTNMIFVPSILHSHMYATREAFTPLFFTSTKELQKYLEPQADPGSIQDVLESAFPTVDPQLHQLFFIAYGTACGFAPHLNEKAPQLGDGPYYGPFVTNATVQSALSDFQAELAVARANVLGKFGEITEGNGKWLPAYFYPKDSEMPFGYGITSTTYV